MKERLDDLIQKHGPFGAVSYLRQYDNGSGDYTKDREKLLEGITMDDIKRVNCRWKSTRKKMDREDGGKTAVFIMRNPEEELPAEQE
jgi:hypothetical protein